MMTEDDYYGYRFLSHIKLNGVPLVQINSTSCLTCASMLATGYGIDTIDCHEIGNISDELNMPYKNLEHSIKDMTPLLGLLKSGLYVIADTDLLNRIIEFSLLAEVDYYHSEYTVRKKWLNGIMLFNTAYEFISIGKFDPALLLMITILESLFFKLRENNTSAILIDRLMNCLIPNGYEANIKGLIREVYNYRNKFVHQGKGLERF